MGVEKIDAPAELEQFLGDRSVTNLMLLVWHSRKDLQQAFDIHTRAGQKAFVNWYDVSSSREYGIALSGAAQTGTNSSNGNAGQARRFSPWLLYSRLFALESRLARASRWLPKWIRTRAKHAWLRLMSRAALATARSANNHEVHMPGSETKSTLPAFPSQEGDKGVNLIGYAHAELGMGEHVRMSAAAFSETTVPFGVVNFNIGVQSRQKASLDHGALSESNRYRANLFHINADQMLLAFSHLGRSFFERRYNIGYWAWELAKCPEEWVPVFGMVDEIWAPSRFIQNAFAERTNLPVVYMPLCVTLPAVPKYSRKYFGLPEEPFLFLFTFDFFSYIDRKNPFASILAFQEAFDRNRNDVGLVIKVMNGDVKSADWGRMVQLIDGDPRIVVVNRNMDRSEILGLFDVCDCFVSLHRSEGFGRGPAEAMYLGKPVIVTNYSGNTDFTLPDNSCLVDFQLVAVGKGQYPFEEGQVWADPSVEHAAWYMNKCVTDSEYCQRLGRAGADYIHNHYNQRLIGGMYQQRLSELGVV